MTRIRSLEARIKALQKALEADPKLHVFCLPTGEHLTAEQRALVSPRDKVVIRCYPVGYLA